MKTPQQSAAARALAAGAVCLAILGGMLVGHAWPLWTGRIVLMRVVPVDPRDLFRGEYVRLSTPANRLALAPPAAAPPSTAPIVHITGKWWNPLEGAQYAQMADSIVYVQLQPASDGEYHAVTISRERVPGAVNLRGRIRSADDGMLNVDYGLDAFYMQEGAAKPLEEALRAGRHVQMEVAIAASGRARIKNLRLDGVPVTTP